MSAPAAQTVGKSGLAAAIGWTRPTLDRRLKSDPNFPVKKRGNQAGGWEFDPVAVRAYLGGEPAAPAIDQAQLRDAIKPPELPPPSVAPTVRQPRRSQHHQGEATARQRKDAADAALRENKLKVENGELVDRGQLRQDLSQVIASLGEDMDALPEEIAKAFNRPDDAPQIREVIDKVRTRMVARASKFLTDE